MKRWLLIALCWIAVEVQAQQQPTAKELTMGQTLQPPKANRQAAIRTHQHPTTKELSALQDSIWHWVAAHKGNNPVADAITSSSVDETEGSVRVRLIRADREMKALFVNRVSDSPLIQLEGFDPDTQPYSLAPTGIAPPMDIELRTQYAIYPTGTNEVRVSLLYDNSTEFFCGTQYALCRFQNGRWEELPTSSNWENVLLVFNRKSADGATRINSRKINTYQFSVFLFPTVYPAQYARYRIYKEIHTSEPLRKYLLMTEFTVSPFVPYTYFPCNTNHLP